MQVERERTGSRHGASGRGDVAVAWRYFEAWNRRDAEAIVACFADGGTYSDPTVGTIDGPAIAAYARGLWDAFPDLRFEIASASPAGEGTVAAQWIMRGTNTGSMQGLPPTGLAVELPGADFIRVDGDAIRSVHGYFDQKAIPTQLGLMAVVQPRRAGPFVFGTAVAVQSGKRHQPGAFSITTMHVRSEAEAARVVDYSRKLASEMLDMSGFIGWTGVTLGDRLVTITAWDSVEASHQLARHPTHRAAMTDFYRGDMGSSAFISTWIRDDIRAPWLRCPGCDRMSNRSGTCACGSELPEPPPYW